MLLLIIEALSHAAEEEVVGFTLREIWAHSGWIARCVIVMLLLMMAASAVVTVERIIAFTRAKRQSVRLAAAVGPLFAQNDVVGILKTVARDEYKASYLGNLIRACVNEMDARADHLGVENAERALAKVHAEEIAKLKRWMTVLATTGSTAPFVGLFGTTFGVINAFQGMATAGSGLASISAGISEALITTGVGIGVAVLGVWAFNYFNARTDKVREELDSSVADLVAWAHKLTQSERAAAK